MGSTSRTYQTLLLLGVMGVGAYVVLRKNAYNTAVARAESFVSELSGWVPNPPQIGTLIEGLGTLFSPHSGYTSVVSPSVYWGYPQQSPLPKQDDQGVPPVEDLRGTCPWTACPPVQPSLMSLNFIWAVPAAVVGAAAWLFSRRSHVPVRPSAYVRPPVSAAVARAVVNHIVANGGNPFAEHLVREFGDLMPELRDGSWKFDPDLERSPLLVLEIPEHPFDVVNPRVSTLMPPENIFDVDPRVSGIRPSFEPSSVWDPINEPDPWGLTTGDSQIRPILYPSAWDVFDQQMAGLRAHIDYYDREIVRFDQNRAHLHAINSAQQEADIGDAYDREVQRVSDKLRADLESFTAAFERKSVSKP